MDPEDPSCNELVEIITDYLENTLPPGERARSSSIWWRAPAVRRTWSRCASRSR